MPCRKPRILVLTSTFPRWRNDAITAFVDELCRRLAARYRVIVVGPHAQGAARCERWHGFAVVRFRYAPETLERLAGSSGILPLLRKRPWLWALVPGFVLAQTMLTARLLARFSFHAIHAHWLLPQGLIGVSLGRLFRVPCLVTAHGGDLFGFRHGARVKRWVVKRAAALTVVSSALAQHVRKKFGDVAVTVAPMGTDAALFTRARREQSLSTRYGKRYLFFAGRLIPEKGPQLLIEAMPRLRARFADLSLVIAGEGVLKESLRARARELGVDSSVYFPGWIARADLPDYFASAELFVAPSFEEGFGLVFVEAALSGAAALGFEKGGVTDILTDGVNGFLFGPLTADALAARVEEILGSPKRLLAVRACARASVEARFGWDSSAAKYLDLLDKIPRRRIPRGLEPAYS